MVCPTECQQSIWSDAEQTCECIKGIRILVLVAQYLIEKDCIISHYTCLLQLFIILLSYSDQTICS